MNRYESLLNFDFEMNQKVINLIAKIDLYKGQWNAVESLENKYLKELLEIATIASIGSSTRIEGVTLNDLEIESLLQNIKISELKTRDEQEVIGYYETLELILANFPDILFSENYIMQLHQNLLRYSTKDMRHRGQYKPLSNQVVAKYPDGIEKIIFNTTEVHLVEAEMRQCINWTNEQLESQMIHPLLIIAFFIYEFLSIHPFQDGNGRLSRLLTTLLLLKKEYLFIRYISFENLIENFKKKYYQALMSSQKNRNKNNENISIWVLFFLEKLYSLTLNLDSKYGLLKSRGGYLNERQKEIKKFIEISEPLKFFDISKYFESINLNTLKKDLQYMKKEQLISSTGKGKGTVYHNKI